MSENNRWYGWIVSRGTEVEDLEFGDFVELTRWGSDPNERDSKGRRVRSVWWHEPMRDLYGIHGAAESLYFEENGLQIELLPKYKLTIVWPEHLLYRICRKDYFLKGQRNTTDNDVLSCTHSEFDPGVHPLAGRVLVQHGEKASKTASNLEIVEFMDNYTPYGKIIEVGIDVNNLIPGDWVLMEPRAGTHFKNDKTGEAFSVVRTRDILGRWDDQPPPVEWVV